MTTMPPSLRPTPPSGPSPPSPISTARRRLSAVAGLAAGAALLAGGLAGPAMASPTAGQTAAASAARPKPAVGGDPTVTIRVGGVRTAENGPPGPPIATGLAGVTFRVTPASTGFADTCVSTAVGACTLPVTANRTYTVTQAGTRPAGSTTRPWPPGAGRRSSRASTTRCGSRSETPT